MCVWIVIILLCKPASSCFFLMIEFLCFWEFLSRLESGGLFNVFSEKKNKDERSLQKNGNDYVFIFLVIMCEMIYIGSLFPYGELLRKILSRR